jgi:alkylated DNA repair dioxygenase AlkB
MSTTLEELKESFDKAVRRGWDDADPGTRSGKTWLGGVLTFAGAIENDPSLPSIGKVGPGLSVPQIHAISRLFKNVGASCRTYSVAGGQGCVLVAKSATDLLLRSAGLMPGSDLECWNTGDLQYETFTGGMDKERLTWVLRARGGKHFNVKRKRMNALYMDAKPVGDDAWRYGAVREFGYHPVASHLRKALTKLLKDVDYKLLAPLLAELNVYHSTKAGIGPHGDTERNLVIGVNLGKPRTLHFLDYKDCKPVKGTLHNILLEHGDVYFFSKKAVGGDWKKLSEVTARHAAGYPDFTKAMFRTLRNKMIKKGQAPKDVAWVDARAPAAKAESGKKRGTEDGGGPNEVKKQRSERSGMH